MGISCRPDLFCFWLAARCNHQVQRNLIIPGPDLGILDWIATMFGSCIKTLTLALIGHDLGGGWGIFTAMGSSSPWQLVSSMDRVPGDWGVEGSWMQYKGQRRLYVRFFSFTLWLPNLSNRSMNLLYWSTNSDIGIIYCYKWNAYLFFNKTRLWKANKIH